MFLFKFCYKKKSYFENNFSSSFQKNFYNFAEKIWHYVLIKTIDLSSIELESSVYEFMEKYFQIFFLDLSIKGH